MWIQNGRLFLDAILKADFQETFYIDVDVHPGLTVEWLSALLQFFLPSNLQYLLVPLHNVILSSFLAICLISGFSILSKNFSREAIVSSAVYIILLPSLIIVPGSTYLDWVLSGTLFLSAALWVGYLNNKKASLIFWVGVSIGLALLTKYKALFVFPAFLLGALLKSYSIKSLIRPVGSIFLIASVVFFLFYPAMWVDPGRVLFSLVIKNENSPYFTVSLSHIGEVWKQFLRIGINLNPMIFIGSVLTIFCLFTNKVKKEILLPGIVGLVYMISLVVAVHLIFYSRTQFLTSVYQLERYSLPAIMLFTVTFFGVIYENQRLEKSYLLRNTLIILLFMWEITKIAFYIMSTYSLF